MTFTAVREGDSHAVTGVQMLAERGNERWASHLLSPGEFAELMLASHVLPPVEAGNLYRRVRDQGQIVEENVALTEGQMQSLGLQRRSLSRPH
jgi:hypothetical protein